MQQIIVILHILFAVTLVALILLQQGKGATMGASFGAGASQTVFGSQGAGSFLLKITAFFGLLFFITSLVLGHYADSNLAAQKKADILTKVEQLSKQQQQLKVSNNASENAAMQINQPSGANPQP